MICLCFSRASIEIAADVRQEGSNTIYGGRNQEKLKSDNNKKKIDDVKKPGENSDKGSDDDDECGICLSGCKADLTYLWRVLPRCKHGFHAACIDKWLKTSATCPICRKDVYVT
ncbi:hypothetical protein ACH5RR_021171 [Cinchona calisaya]|uniref:RING-type domain-containing protein n=1 Tax=Cinchona calisaya TaxID=153742 RepID=A0ABD2ZKD1_9GENT